MKSALCSTCKAEIIWTLTVNWKRNPVDAVPVPTGNMILVEQPDGKVLARVLSPDELAKHAERYQSHFASCRQAAEHRKSR